METNLPEEKLYSPAPKPWHPALFVGLIAGAIVFWPIAAFGLWSLLSRAEARRHQGIVVIFASVIGFFWGWKPLWGLFGVW